jgi:hypothetical protein
MGTSEDPDPLNRLKRRKFLRGASIAKTRASDTDAFEKEKETMTNFTIKTILLMASLAVAFSPAVKADPWNQKTVFTFSGPVEIPGQVLPAGTYVFKLADSSANRHIVQVFNQEENRIFGTFLAIPDYRMQPSDKTIITFHERPAGSPEAVRAWFYPGHNYGHEFVYPKGEARTLAKLNHTPVPAVPADVAPEMRLQAEFSSPLFSALIIAPMIAEEPDGKEVAIEEAFAVDENQGPAEGEELPETASLLPLIGLIGIVSLAGSAVVLRPSQKK